MIEERQLVRAALNMRKQSYAPYSHFTVGAALLSESRKLYTGCNVENAAFTPTNCAERTAFFKAVSEGETRFQAIAIAGGKEGKEPDNYCAPCGVCRQVMKEFCKEDFKIILVKNEKDVKTFTLGELLPEGFGPNNL